MCSSNMLSNVSKNYLNKFYCILEEMIKGMTCAQLTDSISYNFIVQMIPHHMAAIEMSENILKYTTNIAIENIAEEIIKEQTKSIENMKSIQCSCEEHTNCPKDLQTYRSVTDCIQNTMFHEMDSAPETNNLNVNFMREMIPHHEGAVRMSKNALRYSICPDLVPILEAIIISQEKGIAEMRHLLSCMCRKIE